MTIDYCYDTIYGINIGINGMHIGGISMKNNPGKKGTMIMVMLFILTSLLWLQGETVAFAATPTFTETKVEIIGEDQTYQLEIKDKVAGSTYKWSSNNTKVARVSSKGLVTSVGKGTAKIRCIITYPNKKTKTINSTITVIIPATDIKINNATEVNGAHILQVGDTFNFNRDIFPANSSDKTYWSLGRGNQGCVEITNSSSGIVKALKPGKIILVATAARTATEEDAAKSICNDAIIIEVVGLSASVSSVEIIDSTEIKAVFDSPIDERTVIGANNILLDSIDILPKKDIKGVSAADPGKMTAQLSTDKKTLTITSTNRFVGEYGINFSDKIKTTDGTAIEGFYKNIRYVDSTPPSVTDIKIDQSGLIVDIVFNEAIDFSELKVQGGGFVPGIYNTPANPITVNILNNKNNYMPSEDKKSLRINLSNIYYMDFNKHLTVTLSGIKDLSGLAPKDYTIPVIFTADNTPKPMAKLISIQRTSYLTLTATFDRAIEFGGQARIDNGMMMIGVVDDNDLMKVHFTLTEADALKTGVQNVSISSWRSYNVDPKDVSSYQPQVKPVSFDVDKSSPYLLANDFDPVTNILTLTYNKDVTLVLNSGTFNASLITMNDEKWPNNSITYKKMASDDPKVIKLLLGNMTLFGTYTFTLEKFFVMDSYRNYGLPNTISINNAEGIHLELPGPLTIVQSSTNEIYITFADMLDEASATDVRNYYISGVEILYATLPMNNKSKGAMVVLTLADDSIDVTIDRKITINGVKNYSGTLAPISDYERIITLKENVKPYFVEPPVYRSNNGQGEIRLSFSEPIKGSMRVKVTQMGTYTYDIANVVTIIDNTAIITLLSSPMPNSYLQIDILENNVVDLNDNQSRPMKDRYAVVVN